MNSRPLVSIGVPAYNAEAFLGDCLASLAAQTFADFEVTVSDNASTDGTLEVAREHAARDPRFRWRRNERNVGIVPNFNLLVPSARGTYFKWLAADDTIAPDYLERAVSVLERDPGAVLVAPRVRLVDEAGDPLPFDAERGRYVAPHGELKAPPYLPPGLRSRSAAVRFRAVVLDLRDSVLAAHAFALFRADALRATPLFGAYVGSEKPLLAQLSLMGRFADVPAELFSWRIHPDHVGRLSPADAMRRIDTSWGGRFPLMGARQVQGYLRAIGAVPAPPATRARCLAVVAAKVPIGVARQVGDRARRTGGSPAGGRPGAAA